MSRPLLILLLLALVLWAAATFWISQRSSVAAFAMLALCGVALMLVARGVRVRAVSSKAPADRSRAARFVVTRMLADLTRLQVAFLGQRFASEREGRQWLKQAVPRGFRRAFEELSRDLEQARRGDPPASLRLPLRVMALAQKLERAERALEALSPRYPGYALARPVAFVVTENVSTEGNQDPLVLSLAGWDPTKPTLLPQVDLLTICAHEGGKPVVLGQVDFARAARAVEPHLEPTEELEGEPIRVCKGVSLEQLGLALAQVPVGFVLGHSELV